MTAKIVLGTVMTLALFTTTYAQTLDKAKLDQFFEQLAEKNKAMGNLLIAKDGNVLYTRSIGYSQINGTEKKPLTTATRFRIASITKMFTATIIFQLVEERKLQLTDHLDKFFPEVSNAGKITIAHMLSHRSGIPNVQREQNAAGNVQTTPITKDQILALIVKATPDFEPGAKNSYSNSGYFLLALIIERLTGKQYGEALEERITSKIGLADTYSAIRNIDVSKNEALIYYNLGGEWKQHSETFPGVGGSIISTPNDLSIFIQALFNAKIVTKQSLDQMKTMRDGEGMGMTTFTFAGRTFYGETGGGDSYGAWLAYLPEEKLAVVYTTNAKVYPVHDIVSGVVDIYYHEPFQIPTFETINVSPEVLDKYVGVYSSSEAPVKFTITRKDATLFILANGESSAGPLEATAQDQFKIGAITVAFDTAKNQMVIKRGGGERVFTKEK